ncbi:MAG: tRNA pseudouridine(38-40) synthase TruA [Bacteroidetes bacterium GWF2_42_66]|nr:MAG: tRNA pseudouridine(38-40) synthase TruA [Bacteroidetes bacterium GWA2_42_15]OFY03616.1 MAG: tRNA pseudouridine(38-40) synthase TruA [Bacteroidetes bacterium GWE2_42_39]OFY45981.1 MAG: tRNA pseudouridine(38-40) synthase TruA [Bacteroidetes bacterium GWF2_42_66]
MARYKLTIEYDGTRYSGWQLQKGAKSVQGTLIDACKEIFPGEKIELYGAGRTDQGVHALAQVAHLDVNRNIKPQQLKNQLNDRLPHDVVVTHVHPAAPSFHARYDAVHRSYLYQISKRPSAFGKKMVWWVKDPLDIGKMKQVASLFIGMKDFRNFAEKSDEDKSTLVEISNIEITGAGDLILIRVSGSHFLWKQVRRMVGVIVEAGRGKLTVHEVESFFKRPSELVAKLTAPPSGLYLEKVCYAGDPLPEGVAPVLRVE